MSETGQWGIRENETWSRELDSRQHSNKILKQECCWVHVSIKVTLGNSQTKTLCQDPPFQELLKNLWLSSSWAASPGLTLIRCQHHSPLSCVRILLEFPLVREGKTSGLKMRLTILTGVGRGHGTCGFITLVTSVVWGHFPSTRGCPSSCLLRLKMRFLCDNQGPYLMGSAFIRHRMWVLWASPQWQERSPKTWQERGLGLLSSSRVGRCWLGC